MIEVYTQLLYGVKAHTAICLLQYTQLNLFLTEKLELKVDNSIYSVKYRFHEANLASKLEYFI